MQLRIPPDTEINNTSRAYAADIPPRVLEAIFTSLRADEKFIDNGGHNFLASWVPATTWVCRRWRQVALATPKLWSSLDITVRHCDPDAVHTLLARAGDEELSISIDGTALDMPAVCVLVQPYGQRVSHLVVELEESQAETVTDLLTHMGPKLHTLQIFCTASAKDGEVVFDAERVPNLRMLAATDILVRPEGQLRSLKELILDSLWGVASKHHSHREYLYELLSVCPELEFLDLTNALPGAQHLIGVETPTLDFPNLTYLSISELAMDLPANLKNFIVPTTTNITITARYEGCPPERDDETAVLPMDILPQTVGARCCVPDVEIEGTNWVMSIPSFEDAEHSVSRLPDFASHVLDGFPRMFDASFVVFLQIHVAPHMPAYDNWRALLAQFPNIFALTIGGRRAFIAMLQAMRDSTHTSTAGSESKEMLLPKILQMTVCLDAAVNIGTGTDAKVFGAWLGERAAAGRHLESLIVKVPEGSLNNATIHLAGSLVAYMVVRGGRAKIARKDCPTCHGRHKH
ncbi:hypothetical protein C8Q80DRAFT_1271384 [Daedaleopsis nitida]|nr:hypothetical protein C8Q80DRAFT_1271384 [Daedaleopsis nitida]